MNQKYHHASSNLKLRKSNYWLKWNTRDGISDKIAYGWTYGTIRDDNSKIQDRCNITCITKTTHFSSIFFARLTRTGRLSKFFNPHYH